MQDYDDSAEWWEYQEVAIYDDEEIDLFEWNELTDDDESVEQTKTF